MQKHLKRPSIVVPGLVPGTQWRYREHMTCWVYILASRKHGTLYIGVTNNLARRIHEHRQGRGSRFVQKHGVKRLVFVEPHEDVEQAIQREKTMKKWPRAWKIKLVEQENPEWRDLHDDLNR